jgi:hypothetical protein
MVEPFILATTDLNSCSLYRNPPKNIDKPIANSKLATIVPVMLALTISINPALRATREIINSVALPNTAFNRPPMEGPTITANSSVAVLNQMARGTMAIAAVIKTVKAPHSRCSAAMEMGIKTKSPKETRFLIDIGEIFVLVLNSYHYHINANKSRLNFKDC